MTNNTTLDYIVPLAAAVLIKLDYAVIATWGYFTGFLIMFVLFMITLFSFLFDKGELIKQIKEHSKNETVTYSFICYFTNIGVFFYALSSGEKSLAIIIAVCVLFYFMIETISLKLYNYAKSN